MPARPLLTAGVEKPKKFSPGAAAVLGGFLAATQHMFERRYFKRVPASAFQSLKIRQRGSDAAVKVVNISDTGALIECEPRLVPGNRSPFTVEVDGTSVQVAGHILRAEVAQIVPTVTYRAALMFGRPLGLPDLAEGTTDESSVPCGDVYSSFAASLPIHSRKAFEREICRLLPIEAVRVGPSLSARPGYKSVHFKIPANVPRYLQVFFAPTAPFKFEHFLLLEQWARAAETLPQE